MRGILEMKCIPHRVFYCTECHERVRLLREARAVEQAAEAARKTPNWFVRLLRALPDA